MKSQYVKIRRAKCFIIAAGVTGHLGKRHTRCGGRKPGLPKQGCGTWARA